MTDAPRAGVDPPADPLRGSAALRGERYADELAAKRHGPVVTWPSGNDQLLAIARERCGDLSSDRKLLELLAAEFLVWAERRRAVGAR